MNTNTKKTEKKLTLKKAMRLLGKLELVENLPSRNGYGNAPNQFLLRYENGEIMQSYKSIVGLRVYGLGLAFGPDHDYSRTTCGYVGRWCNLSTSERRERLARGECFTLAV